MVLANFFAAIFQLFYILTPNQIIFPLEKINAVHFGSWLLIFTAAKRFGLYYVFFADNAIFLKSNLQLKFTVATILEI